MEKFFLAIIGSGPGGYVAAIQAALKGKKVVLIEKEKLGGICLNDGCIPTKFLLSRAHDFLKMKKSTKGLFVSDVSFDISKIVEDKNETISLTRKNLENLLTSHGIKIIYDEASFVDENTLKLSKNSTTIFAENILIATGSKPIDFPNMPFDDEKILSSTSLLNLNEIPKHVAIIGGGYIGCEFADFLSSFGSQVTLLEGEERILPRLEKQLSLELEKNFKKRNIQVFTKTFIKSIDCSSQNPCIHFLDKEPLHPDKILVAIGRTPHIEELNLKVLPKLSTNPKGFILTNNFFQTSIPHIFAIGDVTGKSFLAHAASKQATIAISHMLKEQNLEKELLIPSVLYTSPEIASVGLTTDEASSKKIEILTGSFPVRALGRASSLNNAEGFALVIASKKGKEILGAHIISPNASELISEMTLAIEQKMTLNDFEKIVHPHPTFSEIWSEAILVALDTPLHMPPKRKL